jgi:hypothetical protein
MARSAERGRALAKGLRVVVPPRLRRSLHGRVAAPGGYRQARSFNAARALGLSAAGQRPES